MIKKDTSDTLKKRKTVSRTEFPTDSLTKKMGFSQEQMTDAIRGSGGFVTEIARRLGCSRSTIYRYKKRYENVASAIFEEKEHLLDTAESALLKQINNGHITAIIFYLKTQGYGRGYGDRTKLDIDGNFITKEKRVKDANADADYVRKVMAELDKLTAEPVDAEISTDSH